MIRKIQHNAYGDPSVLEMVETDEPTPGEGEVRVSVKAVSLNPVDLKTFEGYKPLRRGWMIIPADMATALLDIAEREDLNRQHVYVAN